MMTAEEASVVKLVFSRFMESERVNEKSERTDWGEIDYALEYFEWMTDDELIRESKIIYDIHKKGKIFRCYDSHKYEECFAPFILEAVGSILDLLDNTEILHPKNRYILLYYMSLTETKMIFEER